MPDRDAHLMWNELSRRQVASCGIFDLFAAERVSASGQKGEFWILSARDWVNVVPVLRSAARAPSFLMVRQYRQGAEQITTEFPAGLVEEGEEPGCGGGPRAPGGDGVQGGPAHPDRRSAPQSGLHDKPLLHFSGRGSRGGRIPGARRAGSRSNRWPSPSRTWRRARDAGSS